MTATAHLDLHTHTTASDGIRSPRELIDAARADGLAALAITDHDCVDGLPEAVAYAQSIGFRLFPGIEFSIDYPTGSFHLLGFNVDFRDAELKVVLDDLSAKRSTRANRIVADLNEKGIDIDLDEVVAMAGGGTIGRPHVARVLIRRGYARDMADTFANFMVKGKPGYVKKDKIAFDDAIRHIYRTGGIPIIAHPISIGYADYTQFEGLLKDFISRGVKGLEAYAPLHQAHDVSALVRLAEKYNLVITGGSDYHGDKNERLGCYGTDRLIPAEILPALEEFLARA